MLVYALSFCPFSSLSLYEVRHAFNFHRELNIDHVNQSLRILTNFIAAGSHQSCATLDDIISLLLGFTDTIIKMKLSDAHGLAVKVFRQLIIYY